MTLLRRALPETNSFPMRATQAACSRARTALGLMSTGASFATCCCAWRVSSADLRAQIPACPEGSPEMQGRW